MYGRIGLEMYGRVVGRLYAMAACDVVPIFVCAVLEHIEEGRVLA